MFPKTATRKRYWCEWWFSMSFRKKLLVRARCGAHTCHPRTWKAEAEGLPRVLSQPGRQTKSLAQTKKRKKKKILHTRTHARMSDSENKYYF